MTRSDAVLLGTVVGVAILAVAAYKLAHPKCPWCDTALAALSIGERVVCPQCLTTVNAVRALLA